MAAGVLTAAARGGAQTVQGVTDTEIKIGAFGPLTGPLSWLGQGARDGIALAIQEINDHGGINGRKLVLLHEGAQTPAESIAAAKKLNEQDRVYLTILASGSTGAEAAADYYRDTGAIAFNIIGITPKIREPFARNIFHGATLPASEISKLYVDTIFSYKPRPKRLAALVGSYAFPQAEWKAIQPLIEAAGGEFVSVQTYDLGDKDYTAQLSAIARAKPDMIVLVGQYQEGALAAKQAPERGLRGIPWMVGGGNVVRAYPTIAGSGANGTRSVWGFPFFHGEAGTPMEKFEKSWESKFGKPPPARPNYADLTGYVDMYVVAQAIRAAGSDLSPPNLIKAWESLKNVTPSTFGPWAADIGFPESFSADRHQGNMTMVPIIIENGKWRVIR